MKIVLILIKYVVDNNNVKFVDALLKSILKRKIPLIGGSSITGIILVYYFGFLFSIFLNSIIWIIISNFLYKYYWKMNWLEDVIILFIFLSAKVKNKKVK
ncbi:MAG: hypothetical protein ACM3VV_03220 [Deltaproteobacteria bacterium]|jgi:hypothetical protein|nr:hypothetical protein [Nitrososphaeraceae archaeon]